ncbi:MAG: DUF4872 domain-containing protein [Planctomycetota bacterium]
MTRNRDFKATVRARMAKTGERYTTARAQILGARANISDERPTGEHRLTIGGVCSDTNALRLILEAAGVRAPHTGQPFSEAMLFGLCGGVGFLYAVFEYKGFPPLLSVLTRYDTVPDTFIAGGLERLGLPATTSQTASAAKARQALDDALESGLPALCTIDRVTLADENASRTEMAGGAPDVVAVLAREGDDLLIADGPAEPRRVGADHFAKARAAHKKSKQRLVSIADGTPGPSADQLAAAVRDAVRNTADRYTNAPFKGFASNMGLAGLEKWRRLVTDERDPKGWPSVFAESAHACDAFRRTFQGIEHEFTSPAAGRPMQAEFLAEAAELTGNEKLAEASRAFESAGRAWRAVSEFIATCGVPVVETGCESFDKYRELLDESRGSGTPAAPSASDTGEDAITPERAIELFAALAERLDEVVTAEHAAHGSLLAASDE